MFYVKLSPGILVHSCFQVLTVVHPTEEGCLTKQRSCGLKQEFPRCLIRSLSGNRGVLSGTRVFRNK